MKGLLLIVDYDKFRPKLKSKLHHNLVLTSQTALDVVGLPRFKGAGLQELSNLDKLYSTHLLRYGSSYDVLVDAATIPYTRTLRRVAALVRRISRKGIPNAIAIQS